MSPCLQNRVAENLHEFVCSAQARGASGSCRRRRAGQLLKTAGEIREEAAEECFLQDRMGSVVRVYD
jgi:hypothetical protein